MIQMVGYTVLCCCFNSK